MTKTPKAPKLGPGSRKNTNKVYKAPPIQAFPVGLPPWNQLPDEPDEAWTAFCEYRDQDPPRQARFLSGDLSLSQKVEWFLKWRWFDRCAILDDHMRTVIANERGKFLRETVQEIGAKHRMLLSDARALAAKEVKKLLDTSKARELECMKPSELTKLVSEVVKLERLVIGETTSNEAPTEVDLSNLTVEELRQWQTLVAKTKKVEQD